MMSLMKEIYADILEFSRLIRYWEWQDKLQTTVVAGLLLMMFVPEILKDSFIKFFPVFIVYLYFPFSFGYLLNSIADVKEDKAVGRDFNQGGSPESPKIILVILLVGTVIIPLSWNNVFITAVTIFALIITTGYSVAPVRLKSRGLIGLLVASITQRLPFLFFLPIAGFKNVIFYYIFIWLCLLGFLEEMAHQANDSRNDAQTGIRTWAVSLGFDRSQAVIAVCRGVLLGYLLSLLVLAFLIFEIKYFVLAVVLFVFSNEAVRATMRKSG